MAEILFVASAIFLVAGGWFFYKASQIKFEDDEDCSAAPREESK